MVRHCSTCWKSATRALVTGQPSTGEAAATSPTRLCTTGGRWRWRGRGAALSKRALWPSKDGHLAASGLACLAGTGVLQIWLMAAMAPSVLPGEPAYLARARPVLLVQRTTAVLSSISHGGVIDEEPSMPISSHHSPYLPSTSLGGAFPCLRLFMRYSRHGVSGAGAAQLTHRTQPYCASDLSFPCSA